MTSLRVVLVVCVLVLCASLGPVTAAEVSKIKDIKQATLLVKRNFCTILAFNTKHGGTIHTAMKELALQHNDAAFAIGGQKDDKQIQTKYGDTSIKGPYIVVSSVLDEEGEVRRGKKHQYVMKVTKRGLKLTRYDIESFMVHHCTPPMIPIDPPDSYGADDNIRSKIAQSANVMRLIYVTKDKKELDWLTKIVLESKGKIQGMYIVDNGKSRRGKQLIKTLPSPKRPAVLLNYHDQKRLFGDGVTENKVREIVRLALQESDHFMKGVQKDVDGYEGDPEDDDL